MHPQLARAQLLLQQSRYQQAADEFRQYLLSQPEDAQAHANFSICLSNLKKFEPAMEHAHTATGLAPDSSVGHFAAAYCSFMQNRPREARASVEEAINVDGPAPDLLQLRASISIMEKEWKAALKDADAGLEFDPEDEDLLNIRARALIGLGKRLEASESLDAALQRDPENAFSHANQGWTLIERGKFEQAMVHFREALRLDPDMEWARYGIINAMKARYFLYRIFLNYILWMSKLKAKVQIGLVVGAYFLIQWIDGITRRHPDLAPWLDPIVWVYIAFVMLSWMAIPFFNLLLRTSRFGRLALKKEETRGANLLGAAVLLFIALMATAVVTGSLRFQELGVRCGLLLIPVSCIYLVAAGRSRMTIALATLALAVIGTVPLLPGNSKVIDGALMMPRWAGPWQSLFIYGILGTSIMANFMQAGSASLGDDD